MKRFSLLAPTTLALLFLGVALPSSNAVGQEKTLKEQVVGTWTYVLVDTVNPVSWSIPSTRMVAGCRCMVPIRRVSQVLIAMAAIYC